MTSFEVVYAPSAYADLAGIFDYIADRGSSNVARAYVERIQANCEAMAHFPERGSLRPDLGPGLRTCGFERRATILFRVNREERGVVILGVFYGGREVTLE